MESNDHPAMRVLVVAPRGKDGQLICQVLRRVGIASENCAGIPDCLGGLCSKSGALIAAEEALTS